MRKNPPPATLEINDWLFFLLSGDDEAGCRLALEYLRETGIPESCLELVERTASGPFPACQELASELVLVENFKKLDILRNTNDITPNILQEMLASMPPAMKRAIGKTEWQISSGYQIETWRNHLLTEENPELLAIGFSLLAKVGSPEDANLATIHLNSEHPQLAKAAIDLLYAQNVNLLKTLLLTPLLNVNPQIRFHAIGKLREIDPVEGVAFIQSAMDDDDPVIRLFAIQALVSMPFDLAENTYFQFLGLETHPLLLVLAGREVANQSKEDLPLKIFDTLMLAKGLKKQILQLILDQSITHIKLSGGLSVPAEEYVQSLRQQLRDRRDEMVTALALRDLRHPEHDIRLNAIERLSGFIHLAKVRDALQTRLRKEPEGQVQHALRHLLDSVGVSTGQQTATPAVTAVPGATPAKTLPASPPDVRQFLGMPVKEQMGLLSLIAAGKAFSSYRAFLEEILNKTAPKMVSAKVLSLFEEFGKREDAEFLKIYLRNPDPGIAGIALKTLARLDPDQVLPLLNPLLRHDSLQIKTAALEVLLTLDKEGAFQHLRNLLSSPLKANRRKGLELIPLVDYPVAEPVLLKMLENEKTPELVSQIGLLILSNPNIQGLQAVYKIAHREKAAEQPDLIELWEMARECAAQYLKQDVNQVDAFFAGLLKKEQEETAAPQPAYAFRKAAQKSAPTVPARAEKLQPESFSETLGKLVRSPWVPVVLGIGGLYLVSGLLTPGSPAKPDRQKPYESLMPTSRPMDFTQKAPDGELRPLSVSGFPESAHAVLSGPRYVAVIAEADRQQDEFRKEIQLSQKQYDQQYYERMAKDPGTRAYGLFYLNENCRTGREALECGDFSKAKEEFRKALAEPELPDETRMLVCLGYMGACLETGDKNGMAEIWEKYLALVKNRGLPIPDQINAQSLKGQLDQFVTHSADPGFLTKVEGFFQKFGEKKPAFSPERQNQFLTGMKEFGQKLRQGESAR